MADGIWRLPPGAALNIRPYHDSGIESREIFSIFGAFFVNRYAYGIENRIIFPEDSDMGSARREGITINNNR